MEKKIEKFLEEYTDKFTELFITSFIIQYNDKFNKNCTLKQLLNAKNIFDKKFNKELKKLKR